MDDTDFRLWVAQIPSLNHTQTKELLARVKILSGTGPASGVGKSEFGPRVCASICHVMRKHGVDLASPHVLQRSSAYASAKDKIVDLASYFESISSKRIIQDQILKLAIDLLYVDLLNWQKVAISPHTMLQQIHRIPATLNRYFPGYAQSGLLSALVKEV